MGLGDFFKNIFGKKTCAFCGGECGMLSRTKIKYENIFALPTNPKKLLSDK